MSSSSAQALSAVVVREQMESDNSHAECSRNDDIVPTEPMRLNLDVLVHVMSFMGTMSDVLSFMRTSRDLYEPGARILLSHFRHTVDDQHHFLSFSTFILGTPNRARFLKHFDLEFCSMFAERHDSMATDLARILSLCVNLESLILEESEWIFEIEAVASAIQSLTRLRTIEFHGVGDQGALVIARMNSPLREATITFKDVEEEDQDDADETKTFDPWLILSPFSQHLVNIEITNLPCLGVYTHPVVFENVRFLCLYTNSVEFSSLLLLNTLPRLRELRWNSCDGNSDLDHREAENNRSINELVLDRAAPLFKRRLENRLDYVFCDLSRAYSLALRIKVVNWEGVVLAKPRHIPFLRPVLEDIHPSTLEFTIQVKNFDHAELASVAEAFEDNSVENIWLTLDFDGYTLGDIDSVVEKSLRVISKAGSTGIILQFSDGIFSYTEPTHNQKRIWKMLRELDVEKHMKYFSEIADNPHFDICVLFPDRLRRSSAWTSSAAKKNESLDGVKSVKTSSGRYCKQAGQNEARKVWDMIRGIFRAHWHLVEF